MILQKYNVKETFKHINFWYSVLSVMILQKFRGKKTLKHIKNVFYSIANNEYIKKKY